MHKTEVEILAGRPGSGKTLMASHMCRQWVNENKSVLYISLELSASYLERVFGLPAKVSIIDDPEISWPTIGKCIEKTKPDLTIIDYLQLILLNRDNLINQIIKDNSAFKFDHKLVVLSQLSCNVDISAAMPNHLDMHKAKLTSNPHNTVFTILKKDTYKLQQDHVS
jgi:archaellum biogenesis ATPase FlaH